MWVRVLFWNYDNTQYLNHVGEDDNSTTNWQTQDYNICLADAEGKPEKIKLEHNCKLRKIINNANYGKSDYNECDDVYERLWVWTPDFRCDHFKHEPRYVFSATMPTAVLSSRTPKDLYNKENLPILKALKEFGLF